MIETCLWELLPEKMSSDTLQKYDFCRSAQTFCESLSAVCLFKTISQLRDVLERQAAFFCHFPYYAGLTLTVRFSEKLILNLQCRTRFREMFYESFTQCR